MRRLFLSLALVALMIPSLVALGSTTKYTFEDVTLPDGQTGEITATTKVQKNNPDSVYCGYFTDDYQESLGYYFDFHEPAPMTADEVLQICLDEYDERNT